MSLQAILDRIEAAGEEQTKTIERETQAQIGEILARAHMEAEQIEKVACAASRAPAARERARILHHARLEALRLVGNVREEMVDSALSQTREQLANIRTTPLYADVLHQLTIEALTELAAPKRNENVELVADPRDQTVLKNILPKLDLDLHVSYDLTSWGGLIAKSGDERVVAINTLETRLERATPFLRGHLASLFEVEQSDERMVKTIEN